MQRGSAILLLVLFGFLPIAPALKSDSDSTLPDCCRKAGKHHCSMSGGAEQSDEGSGLALKSNGSTCRLFPQAEAAPSRASCIAVPEAALFFAAIVSHPTVHAQIEGKIGHFDLHYSGGYLKRAINNDQDYSYYTVAYDDYLNHPFYTNFPDGHGGFLDPTQSYHNEQRMTKQSHEFRVSTPKAERLRLTAGLFYQRQANKNLADYFVPGLAATGYTTVHGDDIFTTNTKIVDRDYAAFAESSRRKFASVLCSGRGKSLSPMSRLTEKAEKLV